VSALRERNRDVLKHSRGLGAAQAYWHGEECESRAIAFELLGPNSETPFIPQRKLAPSYQLLRPYAGVPRGAHPVR